MHQWNHIPFQTQDGGSQVGNLVSLGTRLSPGDMMYYHYVLSNYREVTFRGATVTFAYIVPNVRRNSVHARLLPERDLDHLNDEQIDWLIRRCALEILHAPSDEELSPQTQQLIADLLRSQEIRKTFYDPTAREALIAKYQITDDAQKKLLTSVPGDFMDAWLLTVDMGHGDHDSNTYVLFETGERGLPQPEWVTASWDYLAHFRANLGFYTSEAMVYQRVLVIAREPLSELMNRTLRFLRGQGADARPLVAQNADDLRDKLKGLIENKYPLPGGSHNSAESQDHSSSEQSAT